MTEIWFPDAVLQKQKALHTWEVQESEADKENYTCFSAVHIRPPDTFSEIVQISWTDLTEVAPLSNVLWMEDLNKNTRF